LELLSRFENIELADQALLELGRATGLGAEPLYWVGMALREALANAIKHGNKLNPDKRVFVSMRLVDHDELHIDVEDEGEGFDLSQLGDPTAPENLLRSSGRGVFYMKHFMDAVEFHQGDRGGTRISLIKRLSEGESP
jgi:serine/threonine-protein kinase RsbW